MTYRSRAVVLTMGSAYRELGLPEEERLSGHGLSWCATCDGFFFRDKEIAVVGGGDSAMEDAAILGDEHVTGLTLRDTITGAERTFDATGVFVAIGHDPRSELVADHVDTDAGGYVRVAHPSTRTNLAGVFAAGDLVDHTYRQAITAAGTGCAAAQDSQHYLSHRAPATLRSSVLEVSA